VTQQKKIRNTKAGYLKRLKSLLNVFAFAPFLTTFEIDKQGRFIKRLIFLLKLNIEH